jgi:hypothetical protein
MKQTAEETLNEVVGNTRYSSMLATTKALLLKAMEEHASNGLASYKAELKGKIEKLIDKANEDIEYWRKEGEAGSADYCESVIDGYREVLTLLEDNPTEKEQLNQKQDE